MSTRSMRAAVCVILALAAGARADSITFEMSNVFNGATTPSGAPTATIDDMGGTGSVLFTLDLTDLGPSAEKIGAWYFNTLVDIAGFTVTGYDDLIGTVTMPAFAYSFNSTAGSFKADGDGYFDLVLDFATGGAGAFDDGERISFLINFAGITAATFDGMSLSSGSDTGPFGSALHIQGVGANSVSLWLSEGGGTDPDPDPDPDPVPEPGLALLALLGIAGGLVARRRS